MDPALTSVKPEMLVESKVRFRVVKRMFRLETLPVTVDVVTVGRVISRSVSEETVNGVGEVESV